MLGLEPVEPGPLAVTAELGRHGGRERQVRGRVAPPDLLGIAGLGQALRGELPDRLEEREPGLAAGLAAPEQAVVHERREPVQRVDAELGRAARDGLGAGEVEPAAEHRQALEQAPHRGLEEVVAPRDGPAQRALALRHVGRARADDVDPALEALVDRGRREEADPRGGELDGQGHAAQVGDDRGHVARVGVGDA